MGNFRRKVFEVGEVHVDVRIQRLQGLEFFVRVGVVHDGDFGPIDGESLQELRHVVGGGDEVDVVRAHVLEPREEFGEFFGGVGGTYGGASDLEILAEGAAERAAAEEHGSRSVFEGDARFFEGVQAVFGDAHGIVGAAGAALRSSVRAAFGGAEFADVRHTQIVPYFLLFAKHCRYAEGQIIDKAGDSYYNMVEIN